MSKVIAVITFLVMLAGTVAAGCVRPASMGVLILAALLGLIPAAIAKNKGRDFFTWWVYGWALFIVALIHSLAMSERLPEIVTAPAASGILGLTGAPAPPVRIPAEPSEEEARRAMSHWRKCPGCAELIRAEATVCRYCHSSLTTAAVVARG